MKLPTRPYVLLDERADPGPTRPAGWRWRLMGKNGEVLQSSEYGFGDRTGAALSASRWLEGVGLAGIGITLGITGGVEW